MNNFRSIQLKTKGISHGPITRLMSPSDIGNIVKPFVFLDYIEAPAGNGPNFGFHPHSGIATLTFPLTFDIRHEVSTGQVDDVPSRGIEWLVAGKGIWHRANPINPKAELLKGFQIWFALPDACENGISSTLFIDPKEVPRSGPVTVLLGSYEGVVSSIPTPFNANYLWIELKDGQTWVYQPPSSHQVAWIFVQEGEISLEGHAIKKELVVFEEGDSSIKLTAHGDTSILLGSAQKHPHDLVLGYYSVHTSQEALTVGESNIDSMGNKLREAGIIT